MDVLGLKKSRETEIQEELDALMRVQYVDPIESFPEKIDQLFDALNRVLLFHRKISNHSFYDLCFRFIWIKDEVLI
jgi:hypothetical protein